MPAVIFHGLMVANRLTIILHQTGQQFNIEAAVMITNRHLRLLRWILPAINTVILGVDMIYTSDYPVFAFPDYPLVEIDPLCMGFYLLLAVLSWLTWVPPLVAAVLAVCMCVYTFLIVNTGGWSQPTNGVFYGLLLLFAILSVTSAFVSLAAAKSLPKE